MSDHHGRRGARDAVQVVVLRDPVPREPEPIGMSREVQGVAEGVTGARADDDRCDVQDRDGNHSSTLATAGVVAAPAEAAEPAKANRVCRPQRAATTRMEP